MIFIKGQIPWNKGKKTGLIPKSAFKKGHLAPITAFKKGTESAFKGRKHTVESRKKNSFSHLGLSVGEKNSNWKGGKPKCLECGKQLSSYKYKYCQKCFRKCVPFTKQQLKKILGRREMSGIEKKVFTVIEKYQLPYKFVGNGNFFIERKNPDFVNTNGKKIAIEVYWKRHKDEFRKGGEIGWKEERKSIFGKYGWEIIFMEGTKLTENKILNQLKGGY